MYTLPSHPYKRADTIFFFSFLVRGLRVGSGSDRFFRPEVYMYTLYTLRRGL